jgi:mannose-1-phosphate guanylyltransferase
MANDTWALILAGRGGTHLWPASRRRGPEQLLPFLPGERSLLGATVERLREVVPERILVVTAASQMEKVERTVPALPGANVVVETEARRPASASAPSRSCAATAS